MTECESVSTCSEFEVLFVLSERNGKISPFLTVNTDLQYFVPRPPSSVSLPPSCSPSPLMATNPIAHPPRVPGVPVADVPVADMPAADMPAADMPAADVPVADMPVPDVPVPDVPVADLPVADVPTADVPEADLSEVGSSQSLEIITYDQLPPAPAAPEIAAPRAAPTPSYVLSPVRKGPAVKPRRRKKRGRVAVAPFVMLGVGLLIILL